MKIAVFCPANIRNNNAFFTGEHPVFLNLKKKYGYKITYFTDAPDTVFQDIECIYIKKKKIISKLFYYFNKIFYNFKFPYPFYSKINFNSYDIVITEGIFYSLLKYFPDCKKKIILNESITALKKYEDLKLKDIEFINKHFKYAVIVNEKIKMLYQQNNIELKTFEIGHCINLEKIEHKKRKFFDGKIISIGRLTYEKGYEYIVDAFKKLKSRYSNLTLDIYGEGILQNKLQKIIETQNLSESIKLCGFCAYDKLMKKLNEYSLFISHPIETDYIAEAFHMANMEALANGLPVITSDCGGIPYIIKDKAVIVEQKKTQQIVSAVENLIQNTDLYEKMSSISRKFIENNYSLQIITKKYNKILQIIINKEKGYADEFNRKSHP